MLTSWQGLDFSKKRPHLLQFAGAQLIAFDQHDVASTLLKLIFVNETKEMPCILLVDDDIELLKALTKVLEKANYEVVPHSDARSAMEFVNSTKKRFDLVVTDVFMPGMHGIDFLSATKAAFPRVPVIVVTAFGDWGQYMDALHEGATEYLSKPLDKAELLAAVSRALANGKHRVPTP